MSTNANSPRAGPSHCYLDLDIGDWRRKLATAAAFVHATDTRYGFSSKDIRQLGGSELSRIPDLIQMDHEWSAKAAEAKLDDAASALKAPPYGGRIVVELFWDVAPLACENFAKLCSHSCMMQAGAGYNKKASKNNKTPPIPMGECGKPLSYKNSMFHRVVPRFVMQGGDFVFGNGSGGESALGKRTFKDERAGLLRKHDQRGTLAMGNSGKNSNTSQFYLTFDKTTPQCDGKHVVFGRLVSGFKVMDAVEEVGSTKDGTAHISTPSVPIQITDCGIYTPNCTPGSGYWLDVPNEDEDESTVTSMYGDSTPVFMARPRVAIVAPVEAVLEKLLTVLSKHALCEIMFVTDGSETAGDENNNGCPSDMCTCYDGKGVHMVDHKSLKELIAVYLSNHTVDVVVVAPACKHLVTSELTDASTDNNIESARVIVAKPADCLRRLHNSEWAKSVTHGHGWTLDGLL
jgi:peptidylprolyl isomerase